jgi:outer membrane protein OmpA-like peptidoglycan-associated protein
MPTSWNPRSSLHAVAVAVALLPAACGGARVAPVAPTAPPATTLIALLPDPETGVTGHARATNEFGTANLATSRAATLVKSNAAPGAVSTLSEADVARLFGPALAALPPEPKHFTLYFVFESDALTDESSRKVPEILAAVKQLTVPEVVVVGHTDTLGDAAANVALGLKRAKSVQGILAAAGIPPQLIEVASHGEADQLVKTGNNKAEPRNRRVEISVR